MLGRTGRILKNKWVCSVKKFLTAPVFEVQGVEKYFLYTILSYPKIVYEYLNIVESESASYMIRKDNFES